MAKTIEEILGKSINSTKELRAAIKELQDQLVSASEGTQEWTDTADKLTAAQAKLNEVMSAGKSGIDAVEDSIVGMEKKYKELYNTYKLLSEEQRNSPFGREMADELENLSNKLNETKKGVGNFKDNIGRYAQDAVAAFSTMGVSIGGLATPLGLANGGFKTLNATMKANPIFWLIAGIQVITGLFKKLKDAVMSNEESQMAWNEAMSAFQPITDAVSNAFDKLGQVVVKVVGWIGDAFRKAREVKAIITDFLGITDGEQQRIAEQNKLYQELAQRTNELTKAKREQQVLNANQEAEVKTLLDQAAATSNAVERIKLLNEAKRIQQEITDRNIAIAEEEYNILLEKSKLTANDAATNDKLAQAEAAVAKARAEGAAKTKEMNSQITSLTTQTNKYTDALKKEKEEVENLLKTIEENSKTELQKLEDKYNREYNLLKKHGKDTTELTRQYLAEKARLEKEADEQQQTNIKNTLTGQIASSNTAKETSVLLQKLAVIENEVLAEETKVAKLKELDDELQQYKMDNLLWEIENIELTNEEKLAKWQEYYAAMKQIKDEAAEEERQRAQDEIDSYYNKIDVANKWLGIGSDILYSVESLSDAISQNIEVTKDDEEQTKKSSEKKKKQLKTLQDVQLGVSLAMIAAETAVALMDVWSAYAGQTAANTSLALPPLIAAADAISLGEAITRTVAISGMGAAQMAAAIAGNISNKKSIDGIGGGGGGGSAAGTMATPAVIETNPYSYTRQVQTTEEEDALNRPIWVSVTDIESGLNHAQVVTNESSW